MNSYIGWKCFSLLLISVLASFGNVLAQNTTNSPTAEPGLVAYYTFDEGQGATLTDHSGNGHHGKIHGASYTKSPRGFALLFNGVDNFVDLGNPPSLNLQGDLTIEVWLKTAPNDKRNRLIIGDTSGLSVHRNYSLRVDVNNLFFEWGNDRDSSQIAKSGSVLQDRWQHLVLVLEAPMYFIYLDGREIEHGLRSAPVSSTLGAARCIGGWDFGWFKGEMDELRIYNRALTEREIVSHFTGRALTDTVVEPEIVITPNLYGYGQDRAFLDVRVEAFCKNFREPPATVDFLLTRPDWKKPLRCENLPVKATRPGSERYLAEAEFKSPKLPVGNYQISAVVKNKEGREMKTSLLQAVYPQKPAWFGSREGLGDEVLSPWTPLSVEKGKENLTVGVWGRKYVFGSSPFLSMVESKETGIFSGPMRLTGRADGKDLTWQSGIPKVHSQKPSRVVLLQRLAGEAAELTVNTSVEYDGFMRVDWQIRARRDLSLDRLALELPLDGRYARLFYCWPTPPLWSMGYSGTLTNFVSCFKPVIWIGDEERGLQWVAESDQNWSLANPDRAVEAVKNDRGVLLRFTLVDKPVKLKSGETLSYSYGLQATPVKAVDKDSWDYRIIGTREYAQELSLPTNTIEGQPSLKYYAGKGARAFIVCNWQKAFSYMLPLGYEKEFQTLVRASHEAGLQVVPYAAGFLLSERTPEYRDFKDILLTAPVRPYAIRPPYESQVTFFACSGSEAYRDFVAGDLARLMDEYHVDGIYLDSTTMPTPCNNALHGCGYLKPDGTRAMTYPVFGLRELLKRIYTVVKKRQPDGIVDVHVYDALTIPALAFATTYWNGEQIDAGGHTFKPEILPLDRFRTEFIGKNLGVAADFLFYKLGGYQVSLAISLLHDVPTRYGCSDNRDFELLASIWRLRDQFGCKEAAFLPYWKNADFVTISPSNCYVSLYRHPTNGVLAVISNLDRKEAAIQISLAMSKLGLASGATAKDGLNGQAVEMNNDGQLKLVLPSLAWRMVWIENAGKKP